ncbi:MAG: hypothetical protein KAJ03_00965 [Gammaproteobacteria bacterium]|nr:hypothetical protein [Gammaproteobacteria bacterium]
MTSKNKTRVFDGKKYNIVLVADSKRGAQIRARKIRDAGGLARVTTVKKSGGFHASRYLVWGR